MGSFIQLLALTVGGIFLFWFGYTLFFGNFGINAGGRRAGKGKAVHEGIPGMPRTCPVCAARLEHGERVKSTAFPSMGGADRLMYISGCTYCLGGDRRRSCPVCGAVLYGDEFLVARLFDKPRRSHVHVVGCSRCRGPNSRQSLRALV